MPMCVVEYPGRGRTTPRGHRTRFLPLRPILGGAELTSKPGFPKLHIYIFLIYFWFFKLYFGNQIWKFMYRYFGIFFFKKIRYFIFSILWIFFRIKIIL